MSSIKGYTFAFVNTLIVEYMHMQLLVYLGSVVDFWKFSWLLSKREVGIDELLRQNCSASQRAIISAVILTSY